MLYSFKQSLSSFSAISRVFQVQQSTKKGKYVLYWMQGAFRADYNHSLEYAIYTSNTLNLPLIVLAVLDLSYPEANYRSFKFFLEGLADVKKDLEDRNIALHIKKGHFKETLLNYAKKAHLVITDQAYLPYLNLVRRDIYHEIETTVFEVDTNVVVPVRHTSNKMEYGAYTIRPKIKKQIHKFLNDFTQYTYKGKKLESIYDIDPENISVIFKDQKTEYIPECSLKGGSKEALEALNKFLDSTYHVFAEHRSNPSVDAESNLSPYLHFGHISPIHIIKSAKEVDTKPENFETLLEQLVIRRELAHNFTYHVKNLENLLAFLPKWAAEGLKNHEKDKRDYTYSISELENAKTHDIYWNAAQEELIGRGKIHNYMRMYWGKKVIEWSEDTAEAYKKLLYLNNKYALDGRDPNSYAGICWCFGLHDRPFKERKIFGKIRYMSEKGLRRKFYMRKYLERISNLKAHG
ncbi:hypothetical protein HRbin37_01713 [bacterium HR37]|nr:hypothetical protein HRbin37_01713 [bacterium HR37]